MALKLEELRSIISPAIEAVDIEAHRVRYRALDIPRAESVKDIDKRYRWDLFWFSVTGDVRTQYFDGVKRLGGNDTHTDSLLRSIVPAL